MSVSQNRLCEYNQSLGHIVTNYLEIPIENNDIDGTLRSILCLFLHSIIAYYPEIYYDDPPTTWEDVLYTITFGLFGRDTFKYEHDFAHKYFTKSYVDLTKEKINGHTIAIGYFDLNTNYDIIHGYDESKYKIHTIVGFEYDIITHNDIKYIKICNSKFMSAHHLVEIVDKYVEEFKKSESFDISEEDKQDADNKFTYDNSSTSTCSRDKYPDESRVLIKES